MKKYTMKALAGATAAFALIAVGISLGQKDSAAVKASASTTPAITIEGASMRYDTAGLRFGASMTKADFESFIYPEGSAENYVSDSFEVGMLILPASMLGEGEELTVSNADAMKLTMTWNGTLVNENNAVDENGTKVLFKGYVDDVPMAEYETSVVGRAYYRSGDKYEYSEELSRTLLYVAEEAYADTNEATKPSDTQKEALYSNHLKPYYLQATDFSITELAGSTTPTTVTAYDAANKALTVNMPKYANNGVSNQNAIRTNKDYAPDTYVMMEFLGKEAPGTLLFGDKGDLSTGAYANAGVGFWLDEYSGTSDCFGGGTDTVGWSIRSKQAATGKLSRYYLNEAYPNAKFVLVAGAESNAADATKTDLQYYLYMESSGTWSLFDKGRLEGVGYTLGTGKIQVRTVVNGTTATQTNLKMYQPDTLENVGKTLNSVYSVKIPVNDDSAAKFNKSAGTTMSKNEDGSYQLSMPLISIANYNYVATKQAYGSGTYLMAEFTGKNLPGFVLFGVDNVADTLTFDNTDVGGSATKQSTWNGVGIYTDFNWNVLTYKKAATSTATYTAVGGCFTRSTDSAYGILGVDSTFVLIAGAENSGENVTLTYTLYKKEGTTLTKYNAMTYTLEGINMTSGSVMLTSSHQVGGSLCEIKLWTIGTKTEVDTKLAATYTVAPDV